MIREARFPSFRWQSKSESKLSTETYETKSSNLALENRPISETYETKSSNLALENRLITETHETKSSSLSFPRFLTRSFSNTKSLSLRSINSDSIDNSGEVENVETQHEIDQNKNEIFIKVQSEMRNAGVYTNASARVLYEKVIAEDDFSKEDEHVEDEDELCLSDLQNRNLLPKLKENLIALLTSKIDSGLPYVGFASIGEEVGVDVDDIPSIQINLLKTTGAISKNEHDSMLFSYNGDESFSVSNKSCIYQESFSTMNKSNKSSLHHESFSFEKGGLICDFKRKRESSSLIVCDFTQLSETSLLSSQASTTLLNEDAMNSHNKSMNAHNKGAGSKRRVRRLSMTVAQVGNLIKNIEEKENEEEKVNNKEDLFKMMQEAGAIPCFED